jgi:hypothetical protein
MSGGRQKNKYRGRIFEEAIKAFCQRKNYSLPVKNKE